MKGQLQRPLFTPYTLLPTKRLYRTEHVSWAKGTKRRITFTYMTEDELKLQVSFQYGQCVKLLPPQPAEIPSAAFWLRVCHYHYLAHAESKLYKVYEDEPP